MKNTDNKKKYFAFISYKRADEEWAKWFQNELENYHFPSTLNGRTDIADIIEAIPEAFRPPKEFRPVFRDYDELIAGNLPEQIYSALQSSLNLVVICSPHLADDEEAKWVNKEISDFIEIGKKDGTDNIRRIFPFIVEGKPHSGDEQECFPKVLRDLSAEQERIGGNVNEGGNVSEINRERAFVKVLAGMLPEGVDNDMLWPRYDHDKMERERKEKEARDRLLIAQSRFVAERAMRLIDEGDSYLARRLAIEILPKNLEKPDRPYTPEAEVLIRKACEKNNAILRHNGTVIKAIFNTDESKIFSKSFGSFLRIWDLKTGKMCRKIKTISSAPIVCHPIMPIVAIAEKDKIVFRDAKNFNCIGTSILHPHNTNEIDYYIGSMAFSKNGEYIVSGTSDGRIFVWSLDGRLIQTFLHEEGEDLLVSDINFDLKDTIITTTHDSIKVWTFDGEKMVFWKCLYMHKNRTFFKCQVKVTRDGRYIVFSSDNVVYFCDSQNLELIMALPPHEEGIVGLDISFDDKHLVVGSGHCLYVWECDTDMGSPVAKWNNTFQLEFNTFISDVECDRNGNSVIVSLDNGEMRVIDLNKVESPRVLQIEADSIDFSPNGKIFAVITENGWNPSFFSTMDFETAAAAKIYDDETIEMFVDNRIGFDENQITFSNKNNSVFVLRGSWSVEIDKLNIKNNKSTWCTCDLSSSHRCVFKEISRNGKRVVCVLKDGTMLLIDANDGGVIKIMEPSIDRTTLFVSVAFSYDSRFILSSIEEKPNKVWNADTGEFITELPMPENHSGGDICFDKSGKKILLSSKSLGGSIYVWDWDNHKKEARLRWPIIRQTEPKRIEKVAFNADGSLIVTASYEDIRVWDVESGLKLKEYNHSYNKKFVCFSPDGSKIFSSDGTHIFVYDYPPLQSIITETRKRFRRHELSIEERRQYYLE